MPFLAFFAENHCFWTLFWTPLVYDCFSLFSRCQVFPWEITKMTKFYVISRKITKMTTFLENVTDKPDTPKITVFGHFLTKNGDFRQKPRGLDRGFSHFSQTRPTVVSCGVQWCQNCQNVKKTRGLDRDFREKCQNHCFLLFLGKMTKMTILSPPSGIG